MFKRSQNTVKVVFGSWICIGFTEGKQNGREPKQLKFSFFTKVIKIFVNELTGAIRVIDLTDLEYFAANANAITEPMECATKWKEPKSLGPMTDFSIISM